MSNRWAMLAMTGLHRAVLRLSGGRLGGSLGSMRVIELITVGRKSGAERSVILTVPVVEPHPEGERLVVIASRGGDDLQPAWYLNLVAEPHVRVAERGGAGGAEPCPYRARTADAEERARLWPKAVRAYPGYAQYQRKTRRTIPVVILEPLAAQRPS